MTAWEDRALCAEVGGDGWFPEKGGSTREAKKVCRACEVRAECLEYALQHDERFGIWGGLSERERRKLKHQATQPPPVAAKKTCKGCGDTKALDKFPARTNKTGLGFCQECALRRRHRLTVSQLAEVRARRGAGETLMAIAADLGFSHGYLSKLLAGRADPAPDPVVDNASDEANETGEVAA